MLDTMRFFTLAICALLLAGSFAGCLGAQNESAVAEKIFLNDNWLVRSSCLVPQDGAALSSNSPDAAGWYPVSVPSTVLNALVENGVYPDPYVGMNNMLIPDASDEFNADYDLAKYSYLPDGRNPWKDPYWYVTEFNVPKEMEGKRIWLNFEGINYRADVWLNGNQIANKDAMAGMFQGFRFDVTQWAKTGEQNRLAVLIYPVDFPGEPAPPQSETFDQYYANIPGINMGGAALTSYTNKNGGDGEVAKCVTMQCAMGWDWIPEVHDRCMGIWQDVFIEATEKVDLKNVHVVTDLPLPDTSSADVSISFEVFNPTNSKISGKAIVNSDAGIDVSKSVSIEAGETKKVEFKSAEFPEMIVQDPKLWWPNTYGEAHLYNLSAIFEIGNRMADRESLHFGVREINCEVRDVGGSAGRIFYVNGEKIFCKGGAFVPDMMLNFDRQRYLDEVRLFHGANMNMARIWGGGITPPDEFFEACDKYGIMVWQDFWITGDDNGRWGGNASWPLDHKLFLDCAKDTILRLRNHPSLAIWCGGNEMYPCEEIYGGLVALLDGEDGTRPFMSSSGYPCPWENESSGVYSGGPYYWVPPTQYFELSNAGGEWTFKDEVGIPSVPDVEILKKFIPDLGTSTYYLDFPLNECWGYHDACPGNGRYGTYQNAIRDRYGQPTTIEGYVQNAQLLNAENYRSIFEGAAHKMWDVTGGVLLWKVNSAWPSVMWQIYDWYLLQNAGYYYAKNACEPLHVQMNLMNSTVSVVNTMSEAADGLKVSAKAHGLQMDVLWENEATINAAPNQCTDSFAIGQITATSTYFINLELRDASGKLISENLYWRSPLEPNAALSQISHQTSASVVSYADLSNLAKIDVQTSWKIENAGEMHRLTVEISNPSSALAFFTELELRKASGDLVLPVFWNDNYISILPGQKKTIVAEFNAAELEGAGASLQISGWNVNLQNVPISM